MGQQQNQVRNQKIPWKKWKWGHNNPNLWDSGKVILGGKFIVLQAYLEEQEKVQINNQTLHFKELEKEQQIKHRVERRK